MEHDKYQPAGQGLGNTLFDGETVAYSLWRITDSDITAFLRLTSKWSTDRINQLWTEIGHQPAHADSPDQADLLCSELGGIMPHDYDWMLHSAALKDAVTAYEVYLDSAGDEMLVRSGYTWKVGPEKSVNWPTLRTFYSQCLRVDIEPDAIREIRQLRHLLTHQRGDLRTEAQRKQFGTRERGFPSYLAELHIDAIIDAQRQLGEAVRNTERAVLPYVIGKSNLDGLARRRDIVRRRRSQQTG